MRYPTTHIFLKWAGPSVVAFIGASIGLIAALAQSFPRVRVWAESQFDIWWPTVTAPLFLLAMAAVIALYIAALVYTGSTKGLPREGASRLPDKQSAFGVTFKHANIFQPNDDQSKVGLAINVAVWNAGTPAFVTNWRLEVAPDGQTMIHAPFSDIPERLELRGSFDTVLAPTDSLAERTKTTRIDDHPVEGTLLFYVEAPLEAVKSPDTVFKLTLTDSFNIQTTFHHEMKDWLRNNAAVQIPPSGADLLARQAHQSDHVKKLSVRLATAKKMLEQLETKASKWLGHDQFSATAADTWHGLRLFHENVEIELGSSPILANDFPTWDFKGTLIEPYYEPQANKMDIMDPVRMIVPAHNGELRAGLARNIREYRRRMNELEAYHRGKVEELERTKAEIIRRGRDGE